MQIKNFFAQDFYEHHLSTIGNIHFTNREIDVISCLLNARGTGKIAVFLSIDKRTVETHIRNIMSKLECNTREFIIDFMEGSDKIPFFKKYYSLLQNRMIFEKSLKEISKLNRDKSPHCCLIQEKDKDPFIFHIQSHLELAGIKVSIAAREKKRDYTIFILPQVPTEETVASFLPKIMKSQNKILLLLHERKNHKEIPQELMKWDIVDFAKQENYFFAFFLILNKLLPHLNFGKIVAEFKDKYKKTHIDYKLLKVNPKKKWSENRSIYLKWGYFLLACFLIALMGGECLVFYRNKKGNEETTFRSDLIIPMEAAFLNRAELIAQIDDDFKGKEGIQTVALVGIGGSGKTTVARQYAHQQKVNIIWEINVETNTSLIESFENLAHALSRTEEEKGILRNLQEIKNTSERERQLLEFVKVRLKLHSNWLLIYDNMKKFTDIQKYFPLDTETWGRGRVILTTRDNNIQNNKYVNYTLQIEELNENQKLSLFAKIMNQGTQNTFNSAQTAEAKKFLEAIPPFPLDISIAAYYIKIANVSYDKYLEMLKKNSMEFMSIQEDILKESGEYTKTRYSLVTLSLQRLIESHKDFADLLLFIALVDSQNIPKDLLDRYKGHNTVDNFIYNLKRHSLITNKALHSTSKTTFSIHRSTQSIILAYLTNMLNLEENYILIQLVVDTLENYIEDALDKDDLLKVKQLISHLEMFLSHDQLLKEFTKGLIESELGCIYSSLNLCSQANHLFEKALLKLRKNKNYEKIAQSFLFQGYAYATHLDFKNAEISLVESIRTYKKYFPNNRVKIALGMVYLGNVYRGTGEYEKARHLFEQSLTLYEKLSPQACAGKAMALAWLGDTYKCLGDYTKAIDITEEGLEFCRKYLPQGSVRSAWALLFLGVLHRELGNYEKAITLINQSRTIFEKNFSKNSLFVGASFLQLAMVYCDLGHYKKAIDLAEKAILIFKKVSVNNFDFRCMYGLGCIGNAYKGLGDYERAKKYLKQSLISYENQYGKDHIETAHMLESLGEVYLLEDNLKIAQGMLSRALDILQRNKHPGAYKCLESFADLHLKQSMEAAHRQAMKVAQHFKTQANNELNQAFEIVKTHFPVNSPHRVRIELKLKNIEQS